MQPKYPVVIVYADDWNQYSGQHDREERKPYRVARGWLTGFLIEEKDEHLAIAHTCFDCGDVRYVVVVPKCTIIERKDLKMED